MNKKNIWIINEYAGTPRYGMEFRHYYLGKEFVKNDYNVTVVSSTYSHLFKNYPKQGFEKIDGIDFLWLKMFHYKNSHNKKRVFKWFYFMFKCFFLPFFIKKKPDIIIVSPMAPFVIFPAWILSKIYKAKLIYEVKDIWPLSLVELGGYSLKHPFIRLMSWFEKFALEKSDIIVSNLQNYGEHIKNLGINRNFEWISNGVDLDEFKNIEKLPDEVISEIPKDKFIVGYTGTMGVANALDSFLESGKYLEHKDICYLLVGNGQEKKNLQEKYKSKNIIFIDAIEKQQVQKMLALFDVCFLGWNREKLYNYGISANKAYDYMYSSKPIINAFSGKGDIVKLSNCGISVEAEDPKEIAKAVEEIYNLNREQRDILGQNGKKYVLENFTYKKLAQKYTYFL